MLPHSGPMSEQVALFHPHPTSAAWLGFLYATKDGRIRAFRFDRRDAPEVGPAGSQGTRWMPGYR